MLLQQPCALQQTARRHYARNSAAFGTRRPVHVRAQQQQDAPGAAVVVRHHLRSQLTAERAAGHTGRREVLLASTAALGSLLLPAGQASAQAFEVLQDKQLAYQFEYPMQTSSGKPLQLRLARGPSTYQTAPQLTPDGRQRIVTQLMDLRKNVTITITVGPASGVLKQKAVDAWRPNEVALTVLIDRSTARVSSGQRVALNDVEEVKLETRDGAPYWVYEHISQGSPNLVNRQNETYRHAVAATACRPTPEGATFLYTLNLSCPQELWDDLEAPFSRAIESFRLQDPGRGYVSPDSIIGVSLPF